jgi:cyclophilin family peptidyl-prolyl cis-trans isomerase
MMVRASTSHLLSICVGALLLWRPAVGQEAAAPAADSAAPAAGATAPASDAAAQTKAAFEKNFAEVKQAYREIEQLRNKYQTADAAGREKINAELSGHLAHAQSLVNTLLQSALEVHRLAPNSDPQIKELLSGVARYETIGREMPGDQIDGGDQYERALPIIQALIDAGDASRDVYLWGFLAAFMTNDYDLAENYLKQAEEAPAPEQQERDDDPTRKILVKHLSTYAPALEHYRELWTKEAAIRATEAKADDLPRVKLTTSKGEITLELFENEAPQTVANFLTLVEQGFYDGSPFHRVLPGFMAQGGAKQDDGSGGPGYRIRCECNKPDARMHFRGSLSMAHRGPDTGSSQFFLTFVPTPHLDGKHTVFGRVIDGMEVLGDLQHRDPEREPPLPIPDRILEAEVLRDRGHDYTFEKLPGE